MCERVKRVLCAQNFFEQLLTACRCGLVLLAEGGSSYSSEVVNAELQKPGVRDVIRYSRWGAMYLNYDGLVTRI